MTERTDARFQKEVTDALELTGMITDCDLEVSVEEGFVQIEGTVPTRERGEDLMKALRTVKGIQGVELEVHVLHGEDALSLEESFGTDDQSADEARHLMENNAELREIGDTPQ